CHLSLSRPTPPRLPHSFPTPRSSDLDRLFALLDGRPDLLQRPLPLRGHDVSARRDIEAKRGVPRRGVTTHQLPGVGIDLHRAARSEEHTSELQSRFALVCRLLLETKH